LWTGVLPLLARLTTTPRPNVQRHLALAIAHTCRFPDNRAEFGRLRGVIPLVSFLSSSDHDVARNACLAVNNLSLVPANSVALREASAVDILVKHCLRWDDQVMQDEASGALMNIIYTFRPGTNLGMDLTDPAARSTSTGDWRDVAGAPD